MAVVMFLAFVVGAALVVGAYFAIVRVPGMMLQRKLEERLQEISTPGEAPETANVLVKATYEGPLPGFDRMIGGTERGSALGRWIEQSGMKASISAVVLVGAVCGIVAGVIAAAATRAAWSMPAGFAIGFAAPFLVLRVKRTRRMRSFEEQFPEALDLIARALKAGHAFATGLKMVADEMPEPVGPEFRKTFDEQNFGLPLKDALENLTRRVPVLDVRFFATAVLIQRETGGNLSEILENLAHVVRERFKILRQVRVYTAHGRLTGYVLLALPAVLAIALSFINPEHMNMLFRERMGQMMLLGALVMQTFGFLWIKQVVKIEV
jgi:tight adherence protein B